MVVGCIQKIQNRCAHKTLECHTCAEFTSQRCQVRYVALIRSNTSYPLWLLLISRLFCCCLCRILRCCWLNTMKARKTWRGWSFRASQPRRVWVTVLGAEWKKKTQTSARIPWDFLQRSVVPSLILTHHGCQFLLAFTPCSKLRVDL